jgi:hypothetical protein
MAENQEDKELKLREEQDGSVIVGGEELPPKPLAEEGADDERLSKTEEDHPDDESASDGETAEEAEARRERNRQRRKDNKERRKDYIDSLRREIAARDEILARQAERLDAIERRSQSADLAMVDSELQKVGDAYNYYKQAHSDAVTNKDGAAATDAQEKMFAAMRRAEQLNTIKEASKRQTANPAAQPLDPRLKAHAEEWMDRNKWYSPNGEDDDSELIRTLDRRLHQAGWDPTTPEYWQELDERVKKYLPHRTNMNYNRGQSSSRPRTPVASSGREGASTQSSGGYKLSADRVQALKDAGMWDDPAQRAKMIKRYQELDKQEGAR